MCNKFDIFETAYVKLYQNSLHMFALACFDNESQT